ncbi:hypothetical protein [Spiroplasma endosymbiont of Crioceris asparagi]|uniref:hypothetical protein n=1 Tax=Spiroplasma endosymbiont of Crioceris asparagi TaxID=3066286 RepID=UPI0030D30DCF
MRKEDINSSLFWFSLHYMVKNDAELKYIVSTEKELLYRLYPIVHYGLFQYMLYRGICISIIQNDEYIEYSNYILDNYEDLYNAFYKDCEEKPHKIKWANTEERKKLELIITRIFFPYINENCFPQFYIWKNITRAYVAEMALITQWDVNHAFDDELKISEVFPMIYAMNLVNNSSFSTLYGNVLATLDQKKLLHDYYYGREWAEKEVKYLKDYLEILENKEEYNLFLANFEKYRWKNYKQDERRKALFQLSVFIAIRMKEDIKAITMLKDGQDAFDILEDYLPMFIYADKTRNEKSLITKDKDTSFVLSPYNNMNFNSIMLNKYIDSKGSYHIDVDERKITYLTQSALAVFSKIKIMLLTHKTFPEYIEERFIIPKIDYWTKHLELFKKEKNNKFSRSINYTAVSKTKFIILESEIDEFISLKPNSLDEVLESRAFIKISYLINILIGLNHKSTEVFESLDEFIKYVLIVFGPHPINYTVQTKEKVQSVLEVYKKICDMYVMAKKNKEYIINCEKYLELATHLSKKINWKKK